MPAMVAILTCSDRLQEQTSVSVRGEAQIDSQLLQLHYLLLAHYDSGENDLGAGKARPRNQPEGLELNLKISRR
jgi:hypothetical protein